jgi:hypothetical protein
MSQHKGTKRPHTEGADTPGREQLLLKSAEFQARIAQNFCDEAELLPLLLTHGFVRRVRTIEVLVQPVGGDSLKVRLDCAKPLVGEVKAAIARAQGTTEALQELYRVAVRADGRAVREDDAEPEPLEDDTMELEEGDVVSMLVKGGHAGAMTWQGVANMRTKRMELEKIGGEDSVWDAGCSSVETIARSEERQWVEWNVDKTGKGYVIGLSYQDTYAPCTDIGDNSIEFAICIGDGEQFGRDGTVAAFEQAFTVSDDIEYAAGDNLKIVVTGDTVT